jgi:hypothetical protein
VWHELNRTGYGSSVSNPLGATVVPEYDIPMAMLEQALSKTVLEQLDAFGKNHNIRMFQTALINDQILTPKKIATIRASQCAQLRILQ